jgi:hypothetical protein
VPPNQSFVFHPSLALRSSRTILWRPCPELIYALGLQSERCRAQSGARTSKRFRVVPVRARGYMR